jgi:hypothetical protein
VVPTNLQQKPPPEGDVLVATARVPKLQVICFSVSLRDDPFTGKPFCYKIAGNTAHFRGNPPSVEQKNPRFNVHYEVALQK